MGGRGRSGLVFALALACLAASLHEARVAGAEDFCREDVVREAYERSSNSTAPFENKCNSQKYALLEQQFKSLVKLRSDRKEPFTDACMDHVKNFLCLQCTSQETGKPGSWSLCDSKCEGCKLLPLIVPQTSNMYKVCC